MQLLLGMVVPPSSSSSSVVLLLLLLLPNLLQLPCLCHAFVNRHCHHVAHPHPLLSTALASAVALDGDRFMEKKNAANSINSNRNAPPPPAHSTPTPSRSTTTTTTTPTATTATDHGGLSMTVDELALRVGGRGRARLAWDCYAIGVDPALFYGSTIRLGHDDFETILALLPSNRRSQRMGTHALAQLAASYPPGAGGKVEGGVASLSYVSQSSDQTTKLLLRLADGLEVETVIIPWKDARSTLCVSSQVGCRQGCTFCATGKMGIRRSLTSDEILAQMFFAKKICRLYHLPDVTNVVFMGMGEAADNAAAVTRAAQILTTRELFQLAATKVTVSTVGPTPDAFAKFAKAPVVLAWSVHAARDDLRKLLVPTTRHSMVELRQGLIDTLRQRPKHLRTTMLEVALMENVNDGAQEAEELADFARGIVEAVPDCKLVVNLIPYNPTGHSRFRTPRPDRVQAFQRHLWSRGVYAHVRTTRGDEQSAACGQLATDKNQKKQQRPQQTKKGDTASPRRSYE